MDLRKLRYFVAVARAESFTKAAKDLRVSQPSLGVQVKELERSLGTTLFTRHGRGVQLTEAGQILLREAEQILASLNRTERLLESYRQPEHRHILFGSTPASPTKSLMPEIIEACMRRTPALRVSVRQGFSDELRTLVEAGSLDAALCSDAVESDRAVTVHLFAESLFLIGRADTSSAGNQNISFRSLADLPLILDRRSRILRAEVERLVKKEGVGVGDVLEVEPRELKRELILHHGRFAIVPYETFSEDIEAGRMRSLQITEPSIPRRQALVLRSGLSREVTNFLIKTITEKVARLAAGKYAQWTLPASPATPSTQ
jgi:LysR family nitrogen assimilation transcriptional regulator